MLFLIHLSITYLFGAKEGRDTCWGLFEWASAREIVEVGFIQIYKGMLGKERKWFDRQLGAQTFAEQVGKREPAQRLRRSQ